MKRLEDSGFLIFQEDQGCCNFLQWSVWGGTLPFFRWNGCRSRYFLKLWTVLPYGNPKRFHTFSKNWGVSNFEISFQGVMCKKKPMKLGRVLWFSKTKLLNICWISKLCPFPNPSTSHPSTPGVPTTLAARSCVESVGFHLWILSAATARVGPGRLRIWDDGMPGWPKMFPWWFFCLVEKQTQPNNTT